MYSSLTASEGNRLVVVVACHAGQILSLWWDVFPGTGESPAQAG